MTGMVGAVVTALALAPAALADELIASGGFADDFSANPSTSGQWRDLMRDVNGPTDALVWDETNERVVLAQGSETFTSTAGSSGRMFADYDLPDSGWTADFDYWVGGGTAPGGLSPSDGLVIAFNAEPESVTRGVMGYYIFLDNFQNGWDPASGYVGLYYLDHVPSLLDEPQRLAWVDDDRGRDSQWHHARLHVTDGRIRFYIDDMDAAILDYTVANFDASRPGFALFGLTRTDDILIDNVSIQQVPEPATLALFGLGAAGIAAAKRRRRNRAATL